ncbi:hypothetical protein BDF20DRAFT_989911 [Mycotypha africana]|uniref:uncharacterized protein n=1 Tax=Mycotypha africana TaxID=64632 RepID=UPI002301D2A2|nr:uncharacterized protein BDF20DRAFT_989911 [Mycotypha africana]KAI8971636.1 hypothetical protein BDF20DRAFT_989911 [Mycotypha africana]
MPTNTSLDAESKRRSVIYTKSVKNGKMDERTRTVTVETNSNTMPSTAKKSKVTYRYDPSKGSIKGCHNTKSAIDSSAVAPVQNKTVLEKHTSYVSTLFKKTGKETKTKIQSTKEVDAASGNSKKTSFQTGNITTTTPTTLKASQTFDKSDNNSTDESKPDISQLLGNRTLEKKATTTATKELVSKRSKQQQEPLKDQQLKNDMHSDLHGKKLDNFDGNIQASEPIKNDIRHGSHTVYTDNTQLLTNSNHDIAIIPQNVKVNNDYASSSIYSSEVQSVQHNNNDLKATETHRPLLQHHHSFNTTSSMAQSLQHNQQLLSQPFIVTASAPQYNSNGVKCDAQQIQQPSRRRPLSYIEPTCSIYNKNQSYSYTPLDLASPPAEDYSTMHEPPFCCQNPRSNTEPHYAYLNHQHLYHHHIRQSCDKSAIVTRNYTTPSPPMSVITDVNVCNNYCKPPTTPTNNALQNLLVYDGQTQRFVQLIGVDFNTSATAPLTTNGIPIETAINCDNTKYNSTSLQSVKGDWTVLPAESMYEQNQHELEQQQQKKARDYTKHSQQQRHQETAPSDESSVEFSSYQQQQRHNAKHLDTKQLHRKNSNRSLCSLRSTSASVQSCDSKYERLHITIEKERATVKALQKQKEGTGYYQKELFFRATDIAILRMIAFNKDIAFLSKSLDEAVLENNELKKRLEEEKVEKERYKEELTKTLDKMNETFKQLRHLENKNRSYSKEIADKSQEVKILEKKNKQLLDVRDVTIFENTKQGSNDRRLTIQLHQAQSQIKLLKSTMEQFLKLGVFNSDWNTTLSPTTSIDAFVSELKCGRSSRRQPSTLTSKSRSTKSNVTISLDVTSNTNIHNNDAAKLDVKDPSVQSSAPSIKRNKSTDKSTYITDLHTKLQQLTVEKEILQCEYNKAPVSGGNKALTRKRREELETRLDKLDSELRRIKLKLRNHNAF